VAGIVTLEICALTKFQLNYTNIIALPEDRIDFTGLTFAGDTAPLRYF
jgi:hypothetical protein